MADRIAKTAVAAGIRGRKRRARRLFHS